MPMSFVLPDPATYPCWSEFEGDLACIKQAGYEAVELQIADPTQFDEPRVRVALREAELPMCAFQTGTTYGMRGNCLSTTDEVVRRRTIDLLKSFVQLAARWDSVIVFGSLQGRLRDEPDRTVGSARIVHAIGEAGQCATRRQVVLAFEPVNHGEVGFHNTIGEVADLVRRLNLSGVRLMIDTFHMNIEERDMLDPLAGIADILAHVHLSETNRDVLGTGHWDTRAFLAELDRLGYAGYCSVGVYNTRRPRRECIARCMDVIQSTRNQ